MADRLQPVNWFCRLAHDGGHCQLEKAWLGHLLSAIRVEGCLLSRPSPRPGIPRDGGVLLSRRNVQDERRGGGLNLDLVCEGCCKEAWRSRRGREQNRSKSTLCILARLGLASAHSVCGTMDESMMALPIQV